jgi:cysteinyl-tRNA synthetase
VADLRAQGISAAALRHFVFSTHYRKQINLSGPALEASIEAVARIGEFAHRLASAHGGTPELAAAADACEADFRDALLDDLNAPEALGVLFTFVQAANGELDRKGTGRPALERARSVFALMMGVLDLEPRAIRFTVTADAVTPAPSGSGMEGAGQEAVAWAIGRLRDRIAARQDRDFSRSDAIRGEVEGRGFGVKDTAAGTVLEKYV